MIIKAFATAKRITAAFFLISFSGMAQSPQLVINELSQGGQGTTVEYVELLVKGTNSCTSSTADLRNWIVDDNNGTFASGAGTGIAAGCVRFKNVAFWQNIKIGTLILIYDDASLPANPLIPAIDLNSNDGNCRLIIPYSNTTLLEKHATLPGINNIAYPATSVAFTSSNLWTSVIGMRNGGDSFQTRNPANYTVPSHSVSWGDNSTNTKIFFAGDATKRVFNMKNLVSDDPFTQANWTNDSTLAGETPGTGNNAANSAWINSMSNNCQPFVGAALSISASSAAASFCVGDSITLTSSINTGNSWSTSDTSKSIVVVASATITLSNPSACSQASKNLTFGSTTAAFNVDTISGFAPLKVKFTNASQANAVNFTWNFGDSIVLLDTVSPAHTFATAGTYTVVLTAKNATGCSDTAFKVITVLPTPIDPDTLAENTFAIPNVFTPNGDGINDLFLIVSKSVQTFSGLIFDRWGNKVHEWTNINEGWNGRTPSGQQLTAGVFFYVINVTFSDGSSIKPLGTITLIK